MMMGQIVPDQGLASFPLSARDIDAVSPPHPRSSPSVSGDHSNSTVAATPNWVASLDEVDFDEYVPVNTFFDEYLGELEGVATSKQVGGVPGPGGSGAGAAGEQAKRPRANKLAQLSEGDGYIGGPGGNAANTEAQRRYRAKRKAQQSELSTAHELLEEKIRLLEHSAEENVALKGRVRLLAQVEAERSGDRERQGQMFTARALVEVEDAWKSTVTALAESLGRLGTGGRQDDVVRRLQHLVARSVDLCNLVATLEGPAVKQLLDASVLGSYSPSAGYYNARMVEVARGAQLGAGQVSRIIQLRRKFFEAMGQVYEERNRYNTMVLAEVGLARPGASPLTGSGAAAVGAGHVVYRGLSGLRDLLSREQRLYTAFTRAFYTECMSPGQAARLISLCYPEHCCPVTMANTLDPQAAPPPPRVRNG